jgi:transcription-repair coupling factor (superfamily II helicase)
MDRLICGDVGFGKTEVAIRAAFKAVQGGRQVAVLGADHGPGAAAPEHLPGTHGRVSRGGGNGQSLSVARGDREDRAGDGGAGRSDVLVGTHRLLQRDVLFKELGLVIIDEEQRFGVKHKERFKSLRATVDVLLDECDADPADALHGDDRGARHERDRDGTDEPASDPDDREDLR